MAADGVAAEIIEGAYGRWQAGSVRSLGGMYARDYAAIKKELLHVAATRKASNVADDDHGTYWTMPKGDVRQWALWTPDGRTEGNSSPGPANVFPDDSPALRGLFTLEEFKRLQSVRLNALGPDSQLALHKENVVVQYDGQYRLRARFHLPIQTNAGCWHQAGAAKYHLNEGIIYFFPNGMPHAAGNDGKEIRLHLVWDCLMTAKLAERLSTAAAVFAGGGEGDRAMKCPAEKDILSLNEALAKVVIP